jgi:hypothetical protein
MTHLSPRDALALLAAVGCQRGVAITYGRKF